MGCEWNKGEIHITEEEGFHNVTSNRKTSNKLEKNKLSHAFTHVRIPCTMKKGRKNNYQERKKQTKKRSDRIKLINLKTTKSQHDNQI